MKRRIGVSVGFLALIAVLVSACSFPGSSTTPTATPPGSASVQLAHAPTGTLDASWDPAINQATIKVSLVTLAPNSTHTTAIYNGHCGTPGQQVRALPQLSADNTGAGSISDQFTANVNAVPTSGWYIAVNNATGTDVYSTIVIACADIPVTSPPEPRNEPLSVSRSRAVSAIASTRPAKRNCDSTARRSPST